MPGIYRIPSIDQVFFRPNHFHAVHLQWLRITLTLTPFERENGYVSNKRIEICEKIYERRLKDKPLTTWVDVDENTEFEREFEFLPQDDQGLLWS